jgi:hypothetical protein
MRLFVVCDQIVNLDNIVSIEADGIAVKRLWFIGSSTPINLDLQINFNFLLNQLSAFGNFFPVGEHIVNLNNIVSFDIDRGDVVKRIWFLNSETAIELNPPVNSIALGNALRSRGLL